jgi:excisionase family DNA binding protein
MAQAKFLNVRQTAEQLGVHENTVRNWEKRGLLRAVRLPGSGFRRFDAADVERMWKEMTSQLAPADVGPVLQLPAPIRGRIVHGDLD